APVCADLLQPGCSGPGNRPAPQSSRPGAVLRSSREYPVPDGARWQWQSLLQSTGRQTRKTEPGSAPSFFVSVCRLFKVGFGQFCCDFLAYINWHDVSQNVSANPDFVGQVCSVCQCKLSHLLVVAN